MTYINVLVFVTHASTHVVIHLANVSFSKRLKLIDGFAIIASIHDANTSCLTDLLH